MAAAAFFVFCLLFSTIDATPLPFVPSYSSAIPSVLLNNGVQLPMLALGTGGTLFNLSHQVVHAEANVRLALAAGFVAFDTAADYAQVQKGVGNALASVARDSYWITTKVGGYDFISLPGIEYSSITNAMQNDLKQLQLVMVDLMLLHFPPAEVLGDRCHAMQEQWRALEDFYKAKKARAIGVSNYCQADLECLLQTATIVPAVNQILFHVGMGTDPRSLKSYCVSKGIQAQSYSPLGGYNFTTLPHVRKDHTLITGNLTNNIGKRYNKTGAQVSLRWLIEHGVPLNTESSSEKHLRQDLDIFNFNLSTADMAVLDRATTPAGEPNWQFGGIPVVKTCGPVDAF